MKRVPITRTWYYWNRTKENFGIYVARFPATTEDVVAHDHAFYEIVYVESGTAEHITVDAPRQLHPGDLLVIRPQVWHAYLKPRKFVVINCLFDQRLVQQFGSLLESVDGAFELFCQRIRKPEKQPPIILHAQPVDRPLILELLEKIMAEQLEKRNGWQMVATTRLLEILVTVTRLRHRLPNKASNRRTDRANQTVLNAVSYLETNYTQNFEVAPLAQRLHISPGHLSRSFSKHMGMGMNEFVNRLRIEDACQLLQRSDEPIGVIAGRVGYNEIAYFSRCFRNQIGQSPREYRQARLILQTDSLLRTKARQNQPKRSPLPGSRKRSLRPAGLPPEEVQSHR